MNEALNGQQDTAGTNTVQLTADIVSAFVGSPNNTLAAADLPGLIAQVHTALSTVGAPAQPEVKLEPAVSVRSSVKPDYIVCLEDGKKLKMLKRHLMTAYSMTPDQYRAKWGLPADYPMVAPNYAETRRTLAKKIGLGRSRTRTSASATDNTGSANATSTSTSHAADAPKRGRKPKADAQPTAKRGRKPKTDAPAAKRGRPAGSRNKPKAANA